MSGLTLEIPGTLAEPRLGKAGPLEFLRNPDGTSPLFAGYLHGTDAHLGAPSAGAPRTDLSGNGHTLTQTGSNTAVAGQFATGFKGNGEVWLNTPFTVAALAAAGTADEYTILHFAFHPTTDATLHGVRVGAASGVRFDMSASDIYSGNFVFFNGASFTQGVIDTPPAPAWRATEPFMFGMGISLPRTAMTLYRGRDDQVAVGGRTLNAAITSVSVATAMRIGQRTTNVVTNTVSYATLFLDRLITPAEARRIHAGMRRLLVARIGVDV